MCHLSWSRSKSTNEIKTKTETIMTSKHHHDILEIVFTRAAPALDNLFMGCVFNINTVHKTVEKLTFQAFY